MEHGDYANKTEREVADTNDSVKPNLITKMVIDNSKPEITTSKEMTVVPNNSNTEKLIIDDLNVNIGKELITPKKRSQSPDLGTSKKARRNRRFIWDKL